MITKLNKFNFLKEENNDINTLKNKLYKGDKHDEMFYNEFSCSSAVDSEDVKLDNSQEFRKFVKMGKDTNKILLIYTSPCESISRVEIDT